MATNIAAAVLFISIAVSSAAPSCPWRQSDDETTGQIARSGVVEIQSIAIHRRKSAYAAKSADLTYMTLALWLPLAKSNVSGIEYLVRLNELEPIEDEKGRRLLTPGRLQEIPELKVDSQADESAGRDGTSGPILKLTLDAPARSAGNLKLVKGKATVHRVENESLRFEGLAKLVDKPLDHQKLKGYAITPSIETRNGGVEVSLRVPSRHGRLKNWSLTTRAGRLRPDSLGWSPEKEGGVLSQTFRGIGAKDIEAAVLELSMAVPVETRTFSFEFRNLELP
jgi:hypothetical protein